MIENEFTHVHVGTTVFNNFSKTYDYDFDFSKFVEAELIKNLNKHTTYEIVKIQPTVLLLSNRENFIKVDKTEKKVGLNPSLIPEFENLSKNYNVDIFLIMRSYSSGDFIANSSMQLSGHGLYTRSILGVMGSFAYANFIIQGVASTPPTFIGGEDFNYPGENRNGFIEMDFKLPPDIKNMPVEELRKVDEILKEKSVGVTYRALIKTNLIQDEK